MGFYVKLWDWGERKKDISVHKELPGKNKKTNKKTKQSSKILQSLEIHISHILVNVQFSNCVHVFIFIQVACTCWSDVYCVLIVHGENNMKTRAQLLHNHWNKLIFSKGNCRVGKYFYTCTCKTDQQLNRKIYSN